MHDWLTEQDEERAAQAAAGAAADEQARQQLLEDLVEILRPRLEDVDRAAIAVLDEARSSMAALLELVEDHHNATLLQINARLDHLTELVQGNGVAPQAEA